MPFPMTPAHDPRVGPKKVKVFLKGQPPIETTEDRVGIGVMWLCLFAEKDNASGTSTNYPWGQVEKVEFSPREAA